MQSSISANLTSWRWTTTTPSSLTLPSGKSWGQRYCYPQDKTTGLVIVLWILSESAQMSGNDAKWKKTHLFIYWAPSAVKSIISIINVTKCLPSLKKKIEKNVYRKKIENEKINGNNNFLCSSLVNESLYFLNEVRFIDALVLCCSACLLRAFVIRELWWSHSKFLGLLL